VKTIPYLFCTRLIEGWPDRPTGNDHGAAARTLIRWFKLQMSPRSLSCSAHGRIYAPAASNLHYMPSVAVNAAGDRLLRLSGSRATEHVGAFWVGRKASGQTTRPVLIQAGRAYHALFPSDPPETVRWGDYSFTCVDPSGTTFWTVQEYAEQDPQQPVEPGKPKANSWGTWIMSVQPGPEGGPTEWFNTLFASQPEIGHE
jgi:hypothetical protein